MLFLPALLLGTSSLKTPSLNRRGTAELFEISRRARLVQSFEADPAAPVPKLWQQRLGSSEAPDRWARHGRGTWWLIWLDDGEPLLALPSAPHSSALDLLFADELHRSSFDQLPSLKRREPSALEQRCLRLLTSGSAVQWQPSGLASISGSLFPALASVSHGCLRVALRGDRLMAEGPVASRPFAALQVHHPEHKANFVRFDPPSAYLELNSVSLQPLLGSLFNNSLFAQQLDSIYGLPKQLRDVLLKAPVLVRLDALEGGRFQAAIQARLMLAAGEIDMTKRSLDAVATALLKRGFQRVDPPPVVSRWSALKPCSRCLVGSPGSSARWMVTGSCTPRSGGVAAGPGGCPEPPQQSAETDGPTAASPSRTTGSIGSVGVARTGLAAGGWQGTSTGA